MGRRAKIDLYKLTDRVVHLYTEDKLTIREIAELLQSEEYDISRESVRRVVKNAIEAAQDIRKSMEEARVMMDAYRNNPGTDIAEAMLAKFGGLMAREAMNIESIEFDDPSKAIFAATQLANASTKLASVKMKWIDGFEAAKKTVLSRLKEELKSAPDIVERIAAIVNGIEPEVK